jgi:RHS repeat-associated protein
VNANKGLGRLTKLSDGTGSTEWVYDILGRVIQKKQTTGTLVRSIGYGYDTYGRMSSTTYPSGKAVTYTFNANGQIGAIAVNAVNVATNIQYQPFGAAKSWSFGNGAAYARAFDLDGRIGSYPFGAAFQGLGYDLGNRITVFSTATSKSFAYDKLDRLTGFVAGTTNLSYQYDADGNRSQFKNGTAIGAYNYPATSNRLSSITGTGAEGYGYDAGGNITNLAGKTLTYDARGRLKTLTSGTSSWSYGVNGLGQRVTKAGTGFTGSLPFVYDEQGHLIGEYTSTGALTQETVYLGDTPVAILQASATFYIQADQLNTPRVILNSANQQRWRWDLSEPFGNNVPNENPAALGVFKYNLRFPGQYADSETGLNYNTFRDYYPKTGGYIESDPIGLKGGINTYAYVGGNPMLFSDPMGLDVYVVGHVAASLAGYATSPTSYHLAILLAPDDPAATLAGIKSMTLGAQLELATGMLVFRPDYPGDKPANSTVLIRVETPCGETDKSFIRKLVGAAASYQNNLPYSFPGQSGAMAPGAFNSNSFVAGVIKAAGGVPPPLPKNSGWQAPGYSQPVPLVPR